MRTRGILILLLFSLLFIAVPAQAQVTTPQTTSDLPPQTSSLTVGRMAVDFQYVDSTSQHFYAFDGSTTALRLSSEDATLTLLYGQQAPDAALSLPGYNMIGVGLQFGGNNYFVRDTKEQPLALFVPVRVDLSYTNMAQSGDEGGVGSDMPHLHFARGALAVGLGGRFRVTQAIPLLEDRFVVQAHLLKGAGSATNAGASPLHFGLSQVSELHLEARMEQVVGSSMGVTVGYTRQSRNWSNEAPSSVYDVLGALFDGDSLGQSSSQGMLHIGVNWRVASQQ